MREATLEEWREANARGETVEAVMRDGAWVWLVPGAPALDEPAALLMAARAATVPVGTLDEIASEVADRATVAAVTRMVSEMTSDEPPQRVDHVHRWAIDWREDEAGVRREYGHCACGAERWYPLPADEDPAGREARRRSGMGQTPGLRRRSA